MKFLLDENVDIRLAPHLREKGHDVHVVLQNYSPGLSDRDILDIARRERRILLTNDLDFGELVFHQRLTHEGIVLFRLHTINVSRITMVMNRILQSRVVRRHRFIVVTEYGFRIRDAHGGHSVSDDLYSSPSEKQ